MTTVTGFQAVTESGTAVQADAFGNNAAFVCINCHAPLLAIVREGQRGSSPTRPVTCRNCVTSFWLECKTEERTLVVHEVKDFEADDVDLLRVIGRPTIDAGAYRIGSPPNRLAPHNQESWNIIEAILTAYGTADYYDLAVAVRRHKHGDKKAHGPQSFVSYCIRSGWLTRA